MIKQILTHWSCKLSLSLSVGVFFCWLAFRQVHLDEVMQLFSQIKLNYIAAGVVTYAVVLMLRTYRWKKLLNQISSLRYFQVGHVLLVGYAVNNLLPARLGELFRADYCKRQYQLSRSSVLGTIALERLAVSLIVMACFGLGTLAYYASGHSNQILISVATAGSLLFGGMFVFFYILASQKNYTFFNRWPLLARIINGFRDTIRIIRSKLMLTIMGLSVVIWSIEILSIWFVLTAVGIELTELQMLLIVGLISLSTLLPSPPGFLGTLQYAFSIGVGLFGYSAAHGIVAATAFQLYIIGIPTLCGVSILLLNTLVLLNPRRRTSATT